MNDTDHLAKPATVPLDEAVESMLYDHPNHPTAVEFRARLEELVVENAGLLMRGGMITRQVRELAERLDLGRRVAAMRR